MTHLGFGAGKNGPAADNKPPIIVIDDEPGVGMIFSKIFASEGHPIHHFSSAEEAFPFIQAHPSVEIVFLDIRLPGVDGIAALPRFLLINSGLRIVMMTAYQTVESVIKAMKSGAVDYLVKPLDPEMLIQALRKYGASRSKGAVEEAQPREYKQHESDSLPFVAYTAPMKAVLSVAEKFAVSEENVLILGESGTGKELLAHYIHEKSQRSRKPFVVVDCSSIPESLFESELFGYEKGAFTGADSPKAGRFELANGGTLFLDEIGNVPPLMQAKLLRFTEDRVISRLGGKKTISLNIRLIAATNADLQKSSEKGLFREDLYYRLSSLVLNLPPLRNRTKEEKENLAGYFLNRHAQKLRKPEPRLMPAAQDLIHFYPWPGNVRELENALYSAVLLCEAETLDVQHFPIGIQSYSTHKENPENISEGKEKSLREILKKVEREQILSALKQTGGNKKKASEMLDMDYKNFLTKLKEYSQE